MNEKLLLFDDELDKLKQTGWKYRVLWQDEKKMIFAVEAKIPEEIHKKLKS